MEAVAVTQTIYLAGCFRFFKELTYNSHYFQHTYAEKNSIYIKTKSSIDQSCSLAINICEMFLGESIF